jgi:phosphoserine phosphatase RsbU/P
MSLKFRLLLLIVGLLSAAILGLAVSLGWQARNAILLQAESDGTRIARVLAQAASVANTVPAEIEQVIGRQMVSEALLTAHLFDIAEQAGISTEEVNARLMEITARSGISEIWGFDGSGTTTYGSLPDVSLQIFPDPERSPVLSRFWHLLSGEKFSVVGPGIDRDLDGRRFKYAGVRGVSTPGAALVGYDFDFIGGIVDRIGLVQVVRSLLDSGRVNAIWVFDYQFQPLAQGTVFGEEVNQPPDSREQEALDDSIRTGSTASWLAGRDMVVVTPIPGPDGGPIGATLLRLPTDGLQKLMQSSLIYTAIVAGLVLAASLLTATWFSHRLTRPLYSIGEAAQAVEQQRYVRGQLQAVAARRDEFGNLARVFEAMAKQVFARQEELDALVKERTLQLEQKNEQLEAANAQINQELTLAQAMQTAILPAAFPQDPRFTGYAMMQAARHVGGDFYDYFMLDEDRIAVVMADVSGKGVPAAFFMAVSRTVIQSVAREADGPGDCLARANDLVCQENPLELFVTVFYGILDARTGEFRFANGGHNPPYLIGADGMVTALETTGGMALGIMDELPYAEKSVTLRPGDSLFLFTDGVTEAFDPVNEEYGETRLEAALQGSHSLAIEALAQRVVDSVGAFSDTAPQSDDLTCLALRYAGHEGNGLT